MMGESAIRQQGQKPGIGDGQRRGSKGSWRHGGDPVRLDLEPDGFLLVSIARNRFQTEFSRPVRVKESVPVQHEQVSDNEL